MSSQSPCPSEQLRLFKSFGKGLTGRQAGEQIVKSVLQFYRDELTVLDSYGFSDLFRLGTKGHEISGVHVHPTKYQFETWEPGASRWANALITDDQFNMYVGKLLQALETGNFRVGLRKDPSRMAKK